jgi:arylsulfatase
MATKKPNILVIWGDDIGTWNLSAYSHGIMGYRTPNIDRLAKEGLLFTDAYGEQSCTAGRSAFITGQSVFRTGLSKVGIPGSPIGLQAGDPTIAELLKPLGYATGQFGKNHLGDKDEFLPTNHGFDEFFGNLYHLNAEEEPELRDYPPEKDFPNFRQNFGPRGVIHSYADGRIEDTGPLTKKRMETIDDEVITFAKDFIHRQKEADTPFFVWLNTTHMHFRTHAKPESLGQSGRWQSEYHDVMIDHDKTIGVLLNLLENALKFTPDGGQVSLTLLHRTSHWVQVSVSDSGPGIPKDEQQRIFLDRVRLPQTAAQVPGFGVGLSVCRRIVEVHGGRIWVVSAPGEGACFHFTIPIWRGQID